MRLIILLGTLAIALPFIISGVAIPFGNAVSGRFLERPTHDRPPRYTIPLETEAGKPLDATSLTDWISKNGDFAKGYATRVIPLDVLYLLFLGGFLAVASTTLVGSVRWPIPLSGFPTWIWWLLPVVYIVCDFAEDAVIFTMLRWPSTIQGGTMDGLAILRATKIVTVTLSMVQVLLLCLASYIPVSCPGPSPAAEGR
ncbi:hypothetical protein [Bradyrhizobium sp. Cp5.3]|uniref:hypothetical protein n=1 Tax=Bradyrhizobium sp. Cp5.3 TaxID=443598 RepID=UPI0004895EC7|nr:hypothetical protein [Bradyrhizobium sp. Cp5.3]